jgi:tetratricopeptide (TPR) repeat protein
MASGEKKLKEYNFDEAIDDFSKVIDTDSKNTSAYLKRGMCYFFITSYTKSIVDFTKTIVLKGEPSIKQKGYYYRGLARLATKQYQSALSDLDASVEMNPDDFEAHRYRGLARLYLNKSGGLEDIELAVNNYKNNGQYYLDVIQDINRTKSRNPDVIQKVEQWKIESKKLLKVPEENILIKNTASKPAAREVQQTSNSTTDKKTENNKPTVDKQTNNKPEKKLEQEKKPVTETKKETIAKAEPEKKQEVKPEKKPEVKPEKKPEVKPDKKTEPVPNNDIDMEITRPEIWAVIIGVSEYQDSKISLKYASKDAQDFYKFLKSDAGGRVPDDHITLLTDKQATRRNILKALHEKFNRAFIEDVVIFYIASHGQPDPVSGQVYFLNYDAEVKELAGTAIAHAEIERVFRNTKANKKLWIADACHSGAAGGMQARGGPESQMTNHLLDEMSEANPSMALLTASSAQELSYEDPRWGGGHGVFTYSLLQGLTGKANKNNDRFVTIRELYEFIYRSVADETNGQQHPELKGSFDNKLPISVVK